MWLQLFFPLPALADIALLDGPNCSRLRKSLVGRLSLKTCLLVACFGCEIDIHTSKNNPSGILAYSTFETSLSEKLMPWVTRGAVDSILVQSQIGSRL